MLRFADVALRKPTALHVKIDTLTSASAMTLKMRLDTFIRTLRIAETA